MHKVITYIQVLLGLAVLASMLSACVMRAPAADHRDGYWDEHHVWHDSDHHDCDREHDHDCDHH